ncbi:MAG: aminotransferase [Burkholderiales bacterium 68-12]|nr:MAG: aminotransferase [Burkholderiales bacterium 68-12]
MSTSAVTEIDVRTIEPRERHAQIFGRFDALHAGEALQIVNDHDPVPLRYQLESRAAGQFQWAYLQSGPDLWRVLISKLESSKAEAEDSCCSGGACCG